MKMVKMKVYVILYLYWDREWYFILSCLIIYLVKYLKEVIEILEVKDDYYFYLMDV